MSTRDEYQGWVPGMSTRGWVPEDEYQRMSTRGWVPEDEYRITGFWEIGWVPQYPITAYQLWATATQLDEIHRNRPKSNYNLAKKLQSWSVTSDRPTDGHRTEIHTFFIWYPRVHVQDFPDKMGSHFNFRCSEKHRKFPFYRIPILSRIKLQTFLRNPFVTHLAQMLPYLKENLLKFAKFKIWNFENSTKFRWSTTVEKKWSREHQLWELPRRCKLEESCSEG